MLSFIAFPLSATAQGPDSTEKVQVVSAIGKIPGRDLIVHVWVVVPPGADKSEAANEALRNQGARPLTHDEFSTISLFWDQFSDGNTGNDFVTQNYNSKNDPTNGKQGKNILLNTHATWNNVASSIFKYEYGDDTGRCPSLVLECKGPQKFDGNNDVAWLKLNDPSVLGVTWSGTSIDEADMALNIKFPWNTDGSNYDVETVYLHENGHVLGLGHSNLAGAVMEPVYAGARRTLHTDDKAGITFLYPVVNSAPSVTITSPADGSTSDSGTAINFAGTASDTEDGDLTASLIWTSDIYGQIGTGGSFSITLSDGNHDITISVTDGDGATGTDSVSIMVGSVNSAPSVTISSPADSATFNSGITIDFAGTASDTEDDDVTLTASLIWTSDIAGQIGTGGSFSTTLSDGTHTITAQVTDSGEATASSSISLTVGDAPITATYVSVDSITYATEGGKNKDKHLLITIALVDNLGDPVSGASVSIDLYRDGSKIASGTATTGSSGTITFSLKNAASGCYTTTVTDVPANGLTWDGATPANEFCK